jgi:hypothetical protein
MFSDTKMKRTFLTGIAALFLATGTAHAAEEFDWRKFCGSKNEYCDPRRYVNWEKPSKWMLSECTKNERLNYACLRAAGDNRVGCQNEETGEGCELPITGYRWICFGDEGSCRKVYKNASPRDPGVRWDCRRGFQFYAKELDGEKAATFIVKTRNSRLYKACAAYWRCLDDRDAGKVKHCYENDKRWRDFFTGWW